MTWRKPCPRYAPPEKGAEAGSRPPPDFSVKIRGGLGAGCPIAGESSRAGNGPTPAGVTPIGNSCLTPGRPRVSVARPSAGTGGPSHGPAAARDGPDGD